MNRLTQIEEILKQDERPPFIVGTISIDDNGVLVYDLAPALPDMPVDLIIHKVHNSTEVEIFADKAAEIADMVEQYREKFQFDKKWGTNLDIVDIRL